MRGFLWIFCPFLYILGDYSISNIRKYIISMAMSIKNKMKQKRLNLMQNLKTKYLSQFGLKCLRVFCGKVVLECAIISRDYFLHLNSKLDNSPRQLITLDRRLEIFPILVNQKHLIVSTVNYSQRNWMLKALVYQHCTWILIEQKTKNGYLKYFQHLYRNYIWSSTGFNTGTTFI